MVVRRVEILEVDKNFEMRMRLLTDEGEYVLWGYVGRDGKIYNQEGKVVARIKPSYAKSLREVARVKIQGAFAISKKEVEDVLCAED